MRLTTLWVVGRTRNARRSGSATGRSAGPGPAAQLLGPGRPAGTVEEVAGALVAVQAQDATAAALGVRARSRGLTLADVDAARSSGAVVLTWSLRATRYLHRAGDVRWLVGLLGPVLGMPGWPAGQLGVAGETGDRAVRALRDALAASGPLSRRQLRERLAALGVGRRARPWCRWCSGPP